ncbi:MAG: hypothetical protein AAF436_02595 [Myxococcota bacterium]
MESRSLLAFALAVAGSLGCMMGATASAENVHDHQVDMTATLFASNPKSFGEVCERLDGVLTKTDDAAVCERGLSVLAVSFKGDVVRWAMIAYPVSEEDIQGLRQAARARFGKPDAAKNKELMWRLESGVVASAGYDDQYSTFALARSFPE